MHEYKKKGLERKAAVPFLFRRGVRDTKGVHKPQKGRAIRRVTRGGSLQDFLIGRFETGFGGGSALRQLAPAKGFAGDRKAFWHLPGDRQFRAGIQTSSHQ